MASIHEDTERSPYKVTWREEGRQRSRRFSDRPSAQKFLGDLVRRQELGAHATPEASRLTLREFLVMWINTDGAGWQVSTLRQRAWVIDRWIEPFIGGVRLRDLGVTRVKGWRTEIVRKGASAKTVNAASRVLSAALTSAVGEGLIPTNPMLGPAIKPMAQKPTERRAIPITDVEAIRARVMTHRDALIVDLLAYCGLRPGEIVGLRESDVREATLLVARSYGPGGIKSTKTGSVRAVPLLEPVRASLSAYAAVDRAPSAFLLPGDRGGPLNWKNWTRRVWRDACDGLGLDWVPYSGRHTYASLLIASGANVLEVSQRLGHASAKMTLDVYSGLFAEAQFHAGESMEEAIMRERHAVSPRAST